MDFGNIQNTLQNLTGKKITQEELGKALGIKKSAMNIRIKNGGEIKPIEIKRIEEYFNVEYRELHLLTPEEAEKLKMINENCSCSEQYDIPYWEGLPEYLKKNDFTSAHIDKEIIENYWKYDAKNLRSIPIFTNHLNYYPEEKFPFGHIAAMDISSTDINKAGIYCFTTNSGIFIRKINLLMDGSVQFMDYSQPTPQVSKVVTPEQLEEVNFTIIGRVFKCLTTRL